jgi:multiple antibiotic resistance protein
MTLDTFVLCFIPLLVAVDALGVLPIYLGLTEGLARPTLTRILWQSMVTALLVTIGFLYAGEALFRLLGITNADFMVAGGALLFVISVSDILLGHKPQRQVEADSLGAVPLGVPLLVGPAVLTTVLLLSHKYGRGPTAFAALLNIVLAGVAFRCADRLNRMLGQSGMRACSKLASLVLAAIAVRMVREGLMLFLVR